MRGIHRRGRAFATVATGLIFLTIYACYVWMPIISSHSSDDVRLTASDSPVDAFAFICMGKWTNSTILEHTIGSLRRTGRWAGPVYVLTDRQDGWPVLRDSYDVTVVTVPPAKSKLAIHSYKCKMFDYLHQDIQHVVYMDADIIVSRNLFPFLGVLAQHLTKHPQGNMGLFRDSGGHFWGQCKDCDFWHGGVMFAVRGAAEPCLATWCQEIFSGKYSADQEALDFISKEAEECSGMFVMPSRFLMFMKDYTSVITEPVKTFSHVTAAGRLEEQSWFYRWMVRMKLGFKM